MTLFSRYSCSINQTSSSPNRHFVYTPRKTVSGNLCKNLSTIQQSDQKLWPFSADTLVRSNRHPRHRVGILYIPQGKQSLETPIKIWARSNSRIKSYGPCEPILNAGRQDVPTVGSKVMALLSQYSSSSDHTSSSPSSHSIATPRKTASGNPGKTLNVIQRSDKMLWPVWADT
jgi:hypothetical protein